MNTNKPKNTDEYIASFPKDIQKNLEQVRATIKKAAPDAIEKISYAMPTFHQNGNLVHFAAYKNHIGFYPSSKPIKVFKDELTDYKTSKGAIQFPINKPLPNGLINKIIKFRIKENLSRVLGTKRNKK